MSYMATIKCDGCMKTWKPRRWSGINGTWVRLDADHNNFGGLDLTVKAEGWIYFLPEPKRYANGRRSTKPWDLKAVRHYCPDCWMKFEDEYGKQMEMVGYITMEDEKLDEIRERRHKDRA